MGKYEKYSTNPSSCHSWELIEAVGWISPEDHSGSMLFRQSLQGVRWAMSTLNFIESLP